MKRLPKFGKARVRTRRILRSWIFRVAVVLAVLGGTGYAGLWAFGKLERRQSRGLVAKAEGYLKEGQGEAARMGLETALRLDPKNAQALRMLARLREAQGAGPEAMDAMRRLSESGQMTLDDLSAYAVMAARQGDMPLAERLADAAAQGGNPVLRHLLKAEVGMAGNKPEGVEKELRAAVEADKSGMAAMSLARFLTSQGLTAQSGPEVLEILRGASKRQDAVGAEALAMGLRTGVVPRAEAAQWIAAARSHPAAGPRVWAAADMVEIALDPKSKGGVARRAAERVQGKPVEERVAVMVWAMRVGEPQVASGLITPEEAAQVAGVFSVWLDSLSMQGRWDEVSAALAREGQPLPGFLAELYRGRALVERGKVEEGRRAYAKALEAAYAKREDFIQAVAYLGTTGEDWAFEQGLRRALKDFPDKRGDVMRAVVPAVAARRDAKRTRKVYEIASQVEGMDGDLTMQNDRDYLALVLGMPVDAQAVALRSEANPRDFSFRVTSAMALIRAGRGKEALKVLEDCEPDVHVESLVPSQRMVVASALAAAGKTREAEYVAATILPASLSAQEAVFLVEELKKALPAQGRGGG
jgi:tetratricopeptide (TPR) repeat protein